MYVMYFIRKVICEGATRSLIDELLLKIKMWKWKQQYQTFDHFYKNHEWHQAVAEIEKIQEAGQVTDARLYQKGAHAYQAMNQINKATECMEKALSKRSGLTSEEIIQRIEKQAFPQTKILTSTFMFLGGADNLGFISHLAEEAGTKRKYLTKIVPTEYPFNHFAYKERYFHEEIIKHSQVLKNMVPEMINNIDREDEQLLFMTFERIDDSEFTKRNLPDLIQLQKQIAQAVPPSEVVERLKVTDKGKAPMLSALMHRGFTHRLLFKKMRRKTNHLDEHYGLEAILYQLEKIIFDLALYREIKPEDDYVFCHGDFKADNILYDQNEERYYVIDWSGYSLGLKGTDVAKLLVRWGLPFNEIKEQYLNQMFDHQETNRVLHIFFTYQLIIEWVNDLDQVNIERQVQQCIRPAANYIETLVKPGV